MIGLGDQNASFRVYVENRPKMPQYQQLFDCEALQAGDIDLIYQHCGNGWRKLFNVYAKLLCVLDPKLFTFQTQAASWQQYRDRFLLQKASDTALLFDMPQLNPNSGIIHLIAGRTHAKQLIERGLGCQLHWLNEEFAIDPTNKVLVTPYFDYRQLSNEKIEFTAGLLSSLRI
ncbi:hypothetical protein Rhein_0114 [Rheinheimera sp. A13L]|uniref:DUF6942 family protein n=1 Tax=Rheinheimera sp. A13L TaxID=506534 RepID=UPI00021247FA|nr:hypothetical protein [Rheinheimera sp. A13L]EGM79654.1 hypothetical protein Rhein_0114 [Rheinheimera sp. A13L]